MAGLKKMIYVPNEDTWVRITGKAKEKGLSISAYILDSLGDNQLDRIESKVDQLLSKQHPVKLKESESPEAAKEENNPSTDDLVRKVAKLKKQKKDPAWKNPLDGSVCAPKGGKL